MKVYACVCGSSVDGGTIKGWDEGGWCVGKWRSTKNSGVLEEYLKYVTEAGKQRYKSAQNNTRFKIIYI